MAKIDVTEAFKSLEAKVESVPATLKSDIAFLKAHAVASYMLLGGIAGFIAGHFL